MQLEENARYELIVTSSSLGADPTPFMMIHLRWISGPKMPTIVPLIISG